MVPLPLLITLLGLLVGIIVLLCSPERLTPALRRWSLYAKLDKNSRAAQSGQPAILGISREDLRSWTGANGVPLTDDALFVNSALDVLNDGQSRLMNARKVLAGKIEISERLRDTPLLNRASAEARKTQAVWSDFFDDLGKPRVKLPPEQEFDRLTLANELLDELDYLQRQLRSDMPNRIRMALMHLRAEVGRAGEAPDVDRALAAAEDGIRHLRWQAPATLGRQDLPAAGWQGSYRYHLAHKSSVGIALFFLALLVNLALFVIGNHHFTITTLAIVAGVFLAIPLLLVLGRASLKLAPYALSLFKYVYHRFWLPFTRSIILRLRGWRYVLLRDFVTATIVVILLILGVTSALVTTYANREAFGKSLDYIALGLAATTVSIIAAVGGYLTNHFRKPASGSKQ
jgi:hypothetical protein